MGRGGVGSFGACVMALNMALNMAINMIGLMFDDFKIVIGDDDFGLRGISLGRGGDVEGHAALFEQGMDAGFKRGKNLDRGYARIWHGCCRIECRMKNGPCDGLGLLIEQGPP